MRNETQAAEGVCNEQGIAFACGQGRRYEGVQAAVGIREGRGRGERLLKIIC